MAAPATLPADFFDKLDESIQIPQSAGQSKNQLAYQNNNPGNLRFAGQPGARKGANGFAAFDTPSEGYAALEDHIRKNGNKTVEEYISAYAPPNENDTESYIQRATKELGVDRKTPLNKISATRMAHFQMGTESNTKMTPDTLPADFFDNAPEEETQAFPEARIPSYGAAPGVRAPRVPGLDAPSAAVPQQKPATTGPGMTFGTPVSPELTMGTGFTPEQFEGSAALKQQQDAYESFMKRWALPKLPRVGQQKPNIPGAAAMEGVAGSPISEEDIKGLAELVAKQPPNSDTANLLIGFGDAALGLISPENLATMIGAGYGAGAIKAAANAPRVIRALEQMGAGANIKKALDIASRSAVPAAFSAQAGKQAVEAAKQGEPVDALVNLTLAASGALGVRETAKRVSEAYPTPAEKATARGAAATAKGLAKTGENLAASEWAKAVKIDVGEYEGSPAHVQFKGIKKGKPNFDLVDTKSGEVRGNGTYDEIQDLLHGKPTVAEEPKPITPGSEGPAAETETPPTPSPAGIPQRPSPAAAPAEQAPIPIVEEPAAGEIKADSIFETPRGKYTVKSVENGKVTFERESPGGQITKATLPTSVFKKTIGTSTAPPATAAPPAVITPEPEPIPPAVEPQIPQSGLTPKGGAVEPGGRPTEIPTDVMRPGTEPPGEPTLVPFEETAAGQAQEQEPLKPEVIPPEKGITPTPKIGGELAPEPHEISASLTPPPGDRWYGDRGAVPGEPSYYLDIPEDGDTEDARAIITEVDDPKGAYWTASALDKNNEPVDLGKFTSHEDAARVAEMYVDDQKKIIDVKAEPPTAESESGLETTTPKAEASPELLKKVQDTFNELHQRRREAEYALESEDYEHERSQIEDDLDEIKDDLRVAREEAGRYLTDEQISDIEDRSKIRTIYSRDDYPEGESLNEYEDWPSFKKGVKEGDLVFIGDGPRQLAGKITAFRDYDRTVILSLDPTSVPKDAPIKSILETGRFSVKSRVPWENVVTKKTRVIDIKAEPPTPEPKQIEGGPKPLTTPEPIKGTDPKAELKEPEGVVAGTGKLVDAVAAKLGSNESIGDNVAFQKMAREAFGDTDISPRDKYDALEAGINKHLMEDADTYWNAEGSTGIEALHAIEDSIPTQTHRTEEQIKEQQFSTPPSLALLANKLLNPTAADTVLEPSAGTGNLALWPKALGAKVIANELAPRRRGLLELLGFDTRGLDASHIRDLLKDADRPTAVVMNPPFSSDPRSGKHDTGVGIDHVEQALGALKPGGRLVAILGTKQGDITSPKTFARWQKISDKYNIRASVAIDGDAYRKYGTTFGNSIVVIDKTGATPGKTWPDKLKNISRGSYKTPEEAWNDLEQIAADRTPVSEEPRETRPETGVGSGGGEGAGIQPQQPGGVGPSRGGSDRPGSVRGTGTSGEVEPAKGPQEIQRDDAGTGLAENQPVYGEPDLESGAPGPSGLEPRQRVEERQGAFVTYQPQALPANWGAAAHKANIVETSSMAAIEPPPVSIKPNFDWNLVKKGEISEVQLEAIAHAIQAHSQFLPSGERVGFFIGDGTGVGKGREIAGTILHYWNSGKRRIIWVSYSTDLKEDAERDFKDLNAEIPVTLINDFKRGDDIKMGNGVIFTTYQSLSSGAVVKDAQGNAGPKAFMRLEQLAKWAGDEPVIVFDEAHKAKNSTEEKGNRGKQKASDSGLATVGLQAKIPKAMVLYSSATGATEVRNLGYASRLGLWGVGTSFDTFDAFRNAVGEGGVGAMEVVSRDMKAQGRYLSRFISFEGVEYREVTHELTPEQISLYNTAAEAWQTVFKNFNAAIEETNGGGRARMAAMSAFWGANQRFFRQFVTSLKVPTLLKVIDEAHKQDKSVVISLMGTGAAQAERELARIKEEEGTLDDLDFSAADTLIKLIEKSFPTTEWVDQVDENGRVFKVPLLDADGKIQENKVAIEMRDALLTKLQDLRFPDHPIDQILNHLGADTVAEMTGRKNQFLTDAKTGKKEVRRRKKEGVPLDKTNISEARDFQMGRKRTGIISAAASTGISLHSSKRAANQQRRVHIVLETKWSADTQIQDFGRTHRTDQANEPEYVLLSSNVGGEKRFLSTIARRLEQLGALSRGQRDAATSGDLAKYNFESEYGRSAVQDTLGTLARGRTGDIDGPQVLVDMGLINDINDARTANFDAVEVPNFLNRTLGLEPERQNKVFSMFMEGFENAIRLAKERGTFDEGVEDIKSPSIKLAQPPQVVKVQEGTSAKTLYYNLNEAYKPGRRSFESTQRDNASLGFYKNKISGNVYAVEPTLSTETDKTTGAVHERVRLSNVNGGSQLIRRTELGEKYETVKQADAKEWWDAEYAKIPNLQYRPLHIIGGSIMPVWNVLQDGGQRGLKTVRLKTDEGQYIVGAKIENSAIGRVLRGLGFNSNVTLTPLEIHDIVMKDGETVDLAGGMKLRPVTVSGERRMEVLNVPSGQEKTVQSYGVSKEFIQHRARYFVNLYDTDSLPKLLKQYPVVGSSTGANVAGKPASWMSHPERGAAPMLTDIAQWVESLFNEDGPKVNYSGLGALQRQFVRNLTQVEKASLPIHEAAVRAASSRGQAATILKAAVPLIEKELKDSGHTWPELRLAIMESRLRGIRERWVDFANQAESMTEDELKESFEAQFSTLLDAIKGKRGLPTDISQTAATLYQMEDWDTLRQFLGEQFRDAANSVATVMEPDWYDYVVTNPQVLKALGVYKKLVESPMAENHSINEGIFSNALGPLDTYYPLIPIDRKPIQGPGRRLPYRKPQNIANKFATGMSEDYDSSMKAFRDRLGAAVRSNDKAALIKTMEREGWIEQLKRGAPRPQSFIGPDGQEYIPEVVETAGPRTIYDRGKVIHVPSTMSVMPQWLAREMQPILERDRPITETVIDKIIKSINTVSLMGPTDAAFHSANLIGTMIANTPYLGESLGWKVASAPLVKKIGAIVKVLHTDPTTEEAAKDMIEMAKLGLIPDRFGSVEYSKNAAEEMGAEVSRFSFAPLLFGRKGLDIRARLAMYRIAKGANPGATPNELYHFVNQLGNYVPALQGQVERALKRTGLSPFYTAGSTMLRNGINAWLGTGPMPKKGFSMKAWQAITGGAVALLAIWALTNKQITGKYPWEQKDSRLLQIRVPDNFRRSKTGQWLFGKGTEQRYISLAFFNPLVMRGARAMGIPGAYETKQLGGSAGQMTEASGRDFLNAIVQPAMGPVPRALFVGITGQEPYLTNLRDREGRLGPQFFPAIPPRTPAPAIGARAAAAIGEANALFKNLGESTGFIPPGYESPFKVHQKGVHPPDGDDIMKMIIDLGAPGLIPVPSNAERKAGYLERQRAGMKK